MALTTCADCGNQISTEARACPKCGRRAPRGIPRWVRFVVRWIVLLAIALLGALIIMRFFAP